MTKMVDYAYLENIEAEAYKIKTLVQIRETLDFDELCPGDPGRLSNGINDCLDIIADKIISEIDRISGYNHDRDYLQRMASGVCGQDKQLKTFANLMATIGSLPTEMKKELMGKVSKQIVED